MLVKNNETLAHKTQYLTFGLGAEIFAVQTNVVEEVLDEYTVTEIPLSHPTIAGIVNFRGAIVAVLHTEDILSMSRQSNPGEFRPLLILRLANTEEEMLVAIYTDCMKDVYEYSRELKPYPPLGGTYNADLVQGIFKIKNEYVIVLNAYKAFNYNHILNMSAIGIKTS